MISPGVEISIAGGGGEMVRAPRWWSSSHLLYILWTASGRIDGHNLYSIVGALISKNNTLCYIDSVPLTHRTPELKGESEPNYPPHDALDTVKHSAYHLECTGRSTSDSGQNVMPDHLFCIKGIYY